MKHVGAREHSNELSVCIDYRKAFYFSIEHEIHSFFHELILSDGDRRLRHDLARPLRRHSIDSRSHLLPVRFGQEPSRIGKPLVDQIALRHDSNRTVLRINHGKSSPRTICGIYAERIIVSCVPRMLMIVFFHKQNLTGDEVRRITAQIFGADDFYFRTGGRSFFILRDTFFETRSSAPEFFFQCPIRRYTHERL